jgi:hypothetical protein
MKKDKQEAKSQGFDAVQLKDQDFVDYKKTLNHMKEHDE